MTKKKAVKKTSHAGATPKKAQASKSKSQGLSKKAQAKSPRKSPLKSASKSKSPAKSPRKSSAKTATTSKASPKSVKKSSDFLKGESSPPEISAVILSATGKKLKTASGKPVIYGIQEKKGSKTTVKKIEMSPQEFSKKDFQALDRLLKQSAKAQGKRPDLAFFQVKTDDYEKTKTGRIKKTVIKAGPLKGKRMPVHKTKVQFTTPPASAEWRQAHYQGEKFSHLIHKNFQRRNTYEVVKSEMLGQEGFTEYKDAHSRFVAGYEAKDVTLKGRTLTEALRHIQVPVNSLWLNEKKVILEKFRDNQIGNIFVTGNVVVKARGETQTIPIELSARYLTDLPNELGRAIRQRLADRGATYTSPKELAAIAAGAWDKLKKMRGGLRSEKAKREIARLTEPGLSPKSPKLKAHLQRIAKGKASPDSLPLAKTDEVKINLRFAFYRDPLAKTPIKKGRKSK